MTPCFVLEASGPAVSADSIEDNMELAEKQQQGASGDAENSDIIGKEDADDSQSGQCFEEFWDDDDGGYSSYASDDECYQFHEWYLPEAYCHSYEIPVLFEDGMDLVECELYYAAREQGSGGYVSRKTSLKSNNRNLRTKTTSVASHTLFQRGGSIAFDGKHPLPSCLRPSSRRFGCTSSSPAVDVPACQPQRVPVDDEPSPWLTESPGLRRCSYAGVITTTRKTLPLGSPKPKRHQHGKDWFANKNPSATPYATSILNSPQREVQNPEESLTAASSSNHSQDSTLSSLSSSTMPPALPKRRSSLLELHHRMSKSHSELMDMVEPYVSFAPLVQVTTIPAAHEYPYDIRRDLWNTRRELKRFLRLAKSEKRHRQQNQLSDEESEATENKTTRRRTRKNGTRANKSRGNPERIGDYEIDTANIDLEGSNVDDDDPVHDDDDLQVGDDVLDRLDHVQ